MGSAHEKCYACGDLRVTDLHEVKPVGRSRIFFVDLLSIGTTTGLDHLRSTLESKFEIVADMNPSDITGVQIVRDRPNI